MASPSQERIDRQATRNQCSPALTTQQAAKGVEIHIAFLNPDRFGPQ